MGRGKERGLSARQQERVRERTGGGGGGGGERYREINKGRVTEGGGGVSVRAVKQVEMLMRASGMSGNSKPLLLLTGSVLPLQ